MATTATTATEPAAAGNARGSAVEVLIPHYNRAASLARALESLRSQTHPVSICVVDNASTDGTREMLAARFPEVRLLALDRNLGFGAALNRGVATSEASHVVFINNDAVADPRFVEQVLAARTRADAAMVAACLRAPDGKVESLGIEVDRTLSAYDIGHGLSEPSEYAGPEPLGPSGGAALYSREAFDRVGGYDEALFAYLEDVDLAIRMRAAGMRCVLARDAVVWHEHSATLGARSDAKNELLGYARGYLLWKHGGAMSRAERFRAFVVDAVVYAGKAAIDRNLGAVRGRLRAARERRGRPRPPADHRIAELPLLELRLDQALRRRLLRRR